MGTEMLIRLIQGEHLESDLREMPTQLVVRDSCRALEGSA